MKRSRVIWTFFAVLTICLGVAACSGGGGDDDDDDDDDDDGAVTPTPCATIAAPTLANIQAAVFTPECATAGCHNTSTVLNYNLNLSAGSSHSELVGVDATGDFNGTAGQDVLVVAGDSASSYIMRKINGVTGIEGTRMPQPPEPALCQEHKDAIAAWIDAGAQDN